MSHNLMTVSSLNTKIKSLLEATFMHILVEGEVASVTYHTSGHLYFSIKDDKSSIKCVMWRSSVVRMKFRIEKGMRIVVEGSVSVYTPRGEYQFQTIKIEPYGQGALALAFEQLKEKLKAKGYFDAQYKKTIPKLIRNIVLVTAKESAALHDMLKIIERRWPLTEVIVVDTLVQGENAAGQIAASLHYADTLHADVIVVGRGGGSTEDLWAFNEEVVANAIFALNTPVVSAVGHEVDVLISDYVADLRAPTPSAAIEMILPDRNELLYMLDEYTERFLHYVMQTLEHKHQTLQHVEALLLQNSPSRKLHEFHTEYLRLEDEYHRTIEYKMRQFEMNLPMLEEQFHQHISLLISRKEQQIEYLYEKLMLNDPMRQCKEGWAQISQKGKSMTLDKIVIEDSFILEDAFARIEAICIGIERKES